MDYVPAGSGCSGPPPRPAFSQKDRRGLRWNNMDPVVACNPDVVILSSAVFKDPEGIEAGVRKCRRSLDDAAEKYGLS